MRSSAYIFAFSRRRFMVRGRAVCCVHPSQAAAPTNSLLALVLRCLPTMKIIDKIKHAMDSKEPFYSFEFFPPKTSAGVENL